MAFQQGLSGLNGASKAIDVISNNVANSSTIGFKSAQTKFNDVYAAALNGAAAGVQVGIGVNVGAVAQLFNQGNITPTGNPLDLAINGNGFFRVQQPGGAISYTRNGQFEIDKDGYVVNSAGYRLQGYPANALGVILPATPSDIYLNTPDRSDRAFHQHGGGTAAGSAVVQLIDIGFDLRFARQLAHLHDVLREDGRRHLGHAHLG